jgi:hypothetical protein
MDENVRVKKIDGPIFGNADRGVRLGFVPVVLEPCLIRSDLDGQRNVRRNRAPPLVEQRPSRHKIVRPWTFGPP